MATKYYRKFDGKSYIHQLSVRNKLSAGVRKREFKEKGYKVRVTSSKSGYEIWIRR